MADTAGGVTRLADAPSQAGIAPCVQNHPKGSCVMPLFLSFPERPDALALLG